MAAPTDLTDEALASLAHQMATGAAMAAFSEDPRVEELYWRHTGALLSLTPWSFTVATAKLTRFVEPPAAKWAYAHALPSDRLDYPFAFYDAKEADWPFPEFELFEDQVRSDQKTVYALYARRPTSPQAWGALFAEFAKTSLAAEIALLFEDRSKYETFKVHAWGSLNPVEPAGLLLKAVERHARSLPPLQFNPSGGPLIGARYGGW